MKETREKRGLYARVTRTAESSEDVDELFRDDGLMAYVEDAERIAADTLREAGIDPSSLFEVVDEERDGRRRSFLRYADIDPGSLSVEASQALDIMVKARDARASLEDKSGRDGLHRGILLAQACEHLNANRAWRRPAGAGIGTIRGGRKGAEATHGPSGTRQAQYRALFKERRRIRPNESKTDSRRAVAADCGLSEKHGYKTVERATKGQ